MNVYTYINQARQKGIVLTWTHVSLYMKRTASPEDLDRFMGQFEIREDLDPQIILDDTNAYLTRREEIILAGQA